MWSGGSATSARCRRPRCDPLPCARPSAPTPSARRAARPALRGTAWPTRQPARLARTLPHRQSPASGPSSRSARGRGYRRGSPNPRCFAAPSLYRSRTPIRRRGRPPRSRPSGASRALAATTKLRLRRGGMRAGGASPRLRSRARGASERRRSDRPPPGRNRPPRGRTGSGTRRRARRGSPPRG